MRTCGRRALFSPWWTARSHTTRGSSSSDLQDRNSGDMAYRWGVGERTVAMSSKLIVIGGRPGTGKTSLAVGLARALDAVHVRIDTIEQALRTSATADFAVGAAGYVVAHGVALDNLRLGRIVVVDCVNPLASTRAAWRAVANRAGVAVFEVEVI